MSIKITIHLSEPGKVENVIKAILPLSTLQIGLKLLPVRIKEFLAETDIDLAVVAELNKDIKNTMELIEIENVREKLVISIEQ